MYKFYFCKSVPPPQLTLTITPSNTTTLYEGTPVNLTCTATIDTTIVNTAVTVSSMWIAPNGEQLTSSSSNDRITIVDVLQSAPYTSVLMFDPADDMDTGDYQCNVTVVDNSSQPLILPSSTTATTNLNITGILYLCMFILFTFPIQSGVLVNVTLDSLGGPLLAGSSRSLVCSVPFGLSVTLNWMRNGSPVIPTSRVTVSTTSSTSTLMFSPLRTSDGGQYECVLAVMSGTNSSSMIELNVTSE